MQIAIQLFLHFFFIFFYFDPFIVDFQLVCCAIGGIFVIQCQQFFHLLKAVRKLPAALTQQFIGAGAFAEACQIHRRKHKIAQFFINIIIIAGSNAKLLSTELATHLTGRHHKIELFPFSFKDWCSIKDVEYTRLTTKNKGLLSKAYEEYFRQGGFPELISGEENPKEYISTLIDNIISQDIKKRYKTRNIDALKRLAHHMLNETPTLIVKDTLQNIIGIKSERTLGNYLMYLNHTYLISTISKYSSRSRERARNEKSYAIDVAFMDKRENAFSGENLGWRLETIVYLELLRRKAGTENDIYYYQGRSAEADFVVCDGNKTLAVYQISYDISNDKTRKREIKGCIAGAKATKCDNLFLITDHESEVIEEDGYTIQVIPIWEWLTREA